MRQSHCCCSSSSSLSSEPSELWETVVNLSTSLPLEVSSLPAKVSDPHWVLAKEVIWLNSFFFFFLHIAMHVFAYVYIKVWAMLFLQERSIGSRLTKLVGISFLLLSLRMIVSLSFSARLKLIVYFFYFCWYNQCIEFYNSIRWD